MDKKSIITLTFGDVAENHVNMQQIGKKVEEGKWFNCSELEILHKKFNTSELFNLEMKGVKGSVLVIRDGIKILCGEEIKDEIFIEQKNLEWDKKVKMYGRVVNKNARWNLCYDDKKQEPDYENGKGRVISWNDIPNTKKLKEKIRENFGEKGSNLKCEGNYYYDIKKCGIGYHGDSERRIVIGVRLGDSNLPIHFQWYYKGERIGENIKIDLYGGDIYIMSEVCVGTNWKRKNIYTLRHSTGCSKFTTIK